MADYFPMRLVKTAELPPTRNYMMALHPHGMLATATYVNMASEATGFTRLFPGIKRFGVTLSMQFYFPLRRKLASAATRWLSEQCNSNNGSGVSCRSR